MLDVASSEAVSFFTKGTVEGGAGSAWSSS